MSTETTDGQTSADGIIRSGVAAAYEGGVDSYGEVPPTTSNEQLLYSFNKTPLHANYHGMTETSGEINSSRIQTIASLTIAPDEIASIKETLQVRTFEDIIDLGIIHKIYSTFSSHPDLKAIWDTLREDATNGVSKAVLDFSIATEFLMWIDRTEKSLCKGNFYQACSEWLRGSTISETNEWRTNFLDSKNFNPAWYVSRFLTSEAAGGYGSFSPLKRLSTATGISESILGTKSISTVLTQAFYDAEVKVDWGISPRLMEIFLGQERVDGTRYYGGDTTNEFYPSRIVGAQKYFANSKDSSGFAKLHEIFRSQQDIDTDSNTVFQLAQPWTNPAAVSMWDLSFGSPAGFLEQNPLENALPEVLTQLNPCQQLTYLGSILSTELRTSIALGHAKLQSSSAFTDGGGFDKYAFLADSTRNVPANYGAHGTPRTVGQHIFDAVRFDETPVCSDSSRPWHQSMANIVRGGVDPSYRSDMWIPDIFPFEISTTDQDEQDGKQRVGSGKSFKDILNEFAGSNTASQMQSTLSNVWTMYTNIDKGGVGHKDWDFISNLVSGNGKHESGTEAGGLRSSNISHSTSGGVPATVDAQLCSNQLILRVVQNIAGLSQFHSPADAYGSDSAITCLGMMANMLGTKSTLNIHRNYLRKIFFRSLSVHMLKRRTNNSSDVTGAQPTELFKTFGRTGGVGFSESFNESIRQKAMEIARMSESTFSAKFGYGALFTLRSSIEGEVPMDSEIFGDAFVLRYVGAQYLTDDEAMAILISIHNLCGEVRSGTETTRLENAIETSESGGSMSSASSGYPGYACEITGKEMFAHVRGESLGSILLMNSITQLVDDICLSAHQMVDGSGNRAAVFPDQTTRANGMDLGQLLAYVFEMYCLVARTLYNARFMQHTNDVKSIDKSTSIVPSYSSGDRAKLCDFFQRNNDNPGTESVPFIVPGTCYFRIVPKFYKSLGTLGKDGIPRGSTGTAVPTDWTIKNYTSAMQSLLQSAGYNMSMHDEQHGNVGRRKSGVSAAQSWIEHCLNTYTTETFSTEQKLQLQTAGGLISSTGGIAIHNGKSVTLLDWFNMMPDGNSDMSFTNEVLSPVMGMIEHFRTNIMRNGLENLLELDYGSNSVDITERNEKIAKLANLYSRGFPEDFLLNGTSRTAYFTARNITDYMFQLGIAVDSLKNGWYTVSSALSSPTTAAERLIGLDMFRSHPLLDKAASMYLDSLDNSKTHNIFFFGFPPGLIENHMISLVQDDHTRIFTETQSLKVTISANKRSEFADQLKFTPNFSPAEANTGILLHESYIINAMQGEILTFEALVRACEYGRLAPGAGKGIPLGSDPLGDGRASGSTNFPYIKEQTGSDLDSIGLLDQARGVMQSFLLKYIFTRLTRLTVDERRLSTNPTKLVNMGKIRTLIRDLAQPTISAIESSFEFTPEGSTIMSETDSAKTTLQETFGVNEFSIDDIQDLFVDESGNPGSTVSDDQNVYLQADQDKLKKLLEPQPYREGNTVYMSEPKVKKLEQIMTELFSHIWPAQGESASYNQTLAPMLFDTVVGVNFTNLGNDFSVDESSIPDSYTDIIEEHSLGGTGGSTSASDVLTDALSGIVTVDNFVFTVETTLEDL